MNRISLTALIHFRSLRLHHQLLFCQLIVNMLGKKVRYHRERSMYRILVSNRTDALQNSEHKLVVVLKRDSVGISRKMKCRGWCFVPLNFNSVDLIIKIMYRNYSLYFGYIGSPVPPTFTYIHTHREHTHNKPVRLLHKLNANIAMQCFIEFYCPCTNASMMRWNAILIKS